jgi:hypothetical protein
VGCLKGSKENNPKLYKENKRGGTEVREPKDNFNHKDVRGRSN